jgi:hypothetical protein
MMNESHSTDDSSSIDVPRPTAAPLVLAVGIVLAAMGVATNVAFLFVGAAVFVVGLGMWIAQLLPGRGHWREPRVEPSLRPRPITPAPGEVVRLRHGMPGYRLRLPVKVHPVSAGIIGGFVGGLVMPWPALLYGLFSGHGIWWPVNLLAGMVLPGVGRMTVGELEQFHPALVVLAVFIHIVLSLVLGLIYGVLLPTLPNIRKPIAWGTLLLPLLWTAVSYIALGVMNPGVRERIAWPWFIMSQLVFGLVAAVVFLALEKRGALLAGLLGGAVAGLLMPIPALLWSLANGHGIWYPVNVLAAMAMHYGVQPTAAVLEQYHADWFVAALVVHVILSLSFGLAFALILPRVPAIPGPLAWGGLLMPLLWTAMSYGMMGVVNPALQQRVEWPWFVASQFVFGIVAAIVVVRSEEVYIPPAGTGADQRTEFVVNKSID